jgi:hypothetical protein
MFGSANGGTARGNEEKFQVSSSREQVLVQDRESPTPAEVRLQLRNILESPAFHGSKRCQQFLEYACEKSLAGEVADLKERTVAVEVFGRNPHSDLGEDTIVRVGAREVRKRLAQYYVTPAGVASEIRIDLPSGSYVPDFRYVNATKELPPAVTAGHPKRRAARRYFLAGGAILLAAAAAVVVMTWPSRNPNLAAFQIFWDPVFQSPEPLLLAVAHPIVYHPSLRALKMSEQALPPESTPLQRPIHVPPKSLNGSDLIPVFNQYVGFGDMVVATQVAAMLARHSKDVRIRLASGVEFEDLRQAQTLLIGAITNRWTMELQQSWRFQFSRTPDLEAVIVDAGAPQTKARPQWAIPARDDGLAQEDYILVSRLQSSLTGGFLLVAAGLKQFGTEAAGRLLTDPDRLGAILNRMPTGWDKKNLQIVLHAKVIGNTPAQPEVVAWQVWSGNTAPGVLVHSEPLPGNSAAP